jgi:hypothetical protein
VPDITVYVWSTAVTVTVSDSLSVRVTVAEPSVKSANVKELLLKTAELDMSPPVSVLFKATLVEGL